MVGKILIILSFFCIQTFFGQEILKGKIVSDGYAGNIFIANITSKGNTQTNDEGFFEIEAKNGDQIIVTANSIEPLTITLNLNSFKQKPLIIYVKMKTRYLQEVQVKNISAKSLGVVDNVKEYTPVERKIRTAGKFKWYSPLLIPFGGMSVDGLLNTINGKVKRLRKELAIERKEFLLQKLDNMYPDNFYTDTLLIEQKYIRGFKIYSIEVEDLINAINTNNVIMTSFILGELANEYKTEILKE